MLAFSWESKDEKIQRHFLNQSCQIIHFLNFDWWIVFQSQFCQNEKVASDYDRFPSFDRMMKGRTFKWTKSDWASLSWSSCLWALISLTRCRVIALYKMYQITQLHKCSRLTAQIIYCWQLLEYAVCDNLTVSLEIFSELSKMWLSYLP